MKKYDYKTVKKSFLIDIIILVFLSLILMIKIVNTSKIRTDYVRGNLAYSNGEYIETQKIYSDMYNKAKLSFLYNKINDILNTPEIVFIEDSIKFLETIKQGFEAQLANNEIGYMIEIYDLFKEETKRVGQDINKNNQLSYDTLVKNYNLKSLFANTFGSLWNEFEEGINQSISSGEFGQEYDFVLYSAVLENISENTQDMKYTMEKLMSKYYIVKMDQLAKAGDVGTLLSESEKVINKYSDLMDIKWVHEKAFNFTIQMMKRSIEEKDFIKYKTYASKYFAYLSNLPSYLSSDNDIRQVINEQFSRDLKRVQDYIYSNKFEQAIEVYSFMEEYMDIVSEIDVDIEGLKQKIEHMWMMEDPIKMFGDPELVQVSKGKARWGRESYVIATDKSKEILYWGEINSNSETRQLGVSIGLNFVSNIYLSDVLSWKDNPIIMAEGRNDSGKKSFVVYEVLEDEIEEILYMPVDSYEIKEEGWVIIGNDTANSKLKYYEYDGYRFVHEFDLESIDIRNRDQYGTLDSQPRTTFSFYEVGFINFRSRIISGNDSEILTGDINIKFIDEYGNTKQHMDSPLLYTWSIPIYTNNYQDLDQSLGAYDFSVYGVGRHRIEIWWNNIKIAEKTFEVVG